MIKTWPSSWTPLHRAARSGDIEAVRSLLTLGNEVDCRSSIDETPLFLALDHKEVVELLLDRGADVNARRHDGWTPLHWVARHGQKDVLDLLLRKGAQLNAVCANHHTPLHLATGRKEIAQLLLAYGADVNAAICSAALLGLTSLHLAAASGNNDVVRLLLSYGGNVDAQACFAVAGAQLVNFTPLFDAVLWGHIEVAKTLLAHKARVNAKLGDGKTPLHLATSREMADVLLAAGAAIDTECDEGMTPLHTAALLGHHDVVETLLANGATATVRDKSGAPPHQS